MEDLLKIFSIILENRKFDPLKKEKVVIQSQGMSTWITRELSRQLGIFANIDFVFPNAFIDDLFKKCFKDSYDPEKLTRDVLVFRIMKVLSEDIENNKKKYSQIYDYIDEYTSRNFKISSKLSALYDDYQIFRYEMINRWNSDSNKDDWQAELYREIKPKNIPDRSQLLYKLQKMSFTREEISSLIGTTDIFIFGISVLPPYYLKIFEFLSQYIDVHMFLMNPCREFWVDIKTEREKAHKFIQAAQKSGIENLEESDLHFFTGNTLLAEFGGMGREFFSQLLDTDSQVEVSQTKNQNTPNTLLEHIQDQISELYQSDEDKIKINKDDDSLIISSCHGKRREIEVLKDYILDILQKDPNIQPSDIIVMAPNIQDYYQLVDGVFSKSYAGERLAYSISDLSVRQENQLVDLFLKLISLSKNNIKASDLIELVEDPIIMESFNIIENDLVIIRNWVRETNMRVDVVSDDLYTINHGLKQLLSGFLMNEERVFEDSITCYKDVEGSQALLLGNILELIELLKYIQLETKELKTLNEWGTFLHSVVERFEDVDISYSQQKIIRDTISVFTEEKDIQTLSGFDKPVGFETIRLYIERKLGSNISSKGFLSKGITFSSMLPMRSIPFKVICLLGLDQDTFPRKDPKLEFDLIKSHPKLGDRSSRKSDIYLFLEALMSSREYFYMSYIGQDSKDNSQRNPSVVLEQLVEYIETNFYIEDADILDHLIKRHRLQAFHSDYFRPDSKLFSYNEENLEVSKAYNLQKTDNQDFSINDSLESDIREYTPIDIIRFFKAPCEFYLKNEKDIIFLQNDDDVKDYEDYQIDGLQRYILVKKIYEHLLAGKDKHDIFSLIKYKGMLPVENYGELIFEEEYKKALALYDEIKDKQFSIQTVRYSFEDIMISGNINTTGDSHLKTIFSGFKGKYMMEALLEHLMLSATSKAHKETVVIYPAKDNKIEKITLKRPQDPEKKFNEMLEIFREGIQKNIPLFPESIYGYYDKYKSKKEHNDKCLNEAITAFSGSYIYSGAVDDIYNRFFYKDTNMLENEDFKSYCYSISELFSDMEVEDE